MILKGFLAAFLYLAYNKSDVYGDMIDYAFFSLAKLHDFALTNDTIELMQILILYEIKVAAMQNYAKTCLWC